MNPTLGAVIVMTVAMGTLIVGTPVGAQEKVSEKASYLRSLSAPLPHAFASISGVRELSDGRLLVNDPVSRRLVVVDAAFANWQVIADQGIGQFISYGPEAAGMIPFAGDSTLLVQPASLSMLVLSPEGKSARVVALPRTDHARFLNGILSGRPGIDANGRLVYRVGPPSRSPLAKNSTGGPSTQSDTAVLLRYDFSSRVLDTLAYLKAFKPVYASRVSGDGRTSYQSLVNPIPVVDEWTVLSSGRVAVLRAADYRLDVVSASGELHRGRPIPIQWRRLDEAAKIAILDSTAKAMSQRQSAPASDVTGANSPGMIIESVTSVVGALPPLRKQETPPPKQEDFIVPPSELPDYQPPFASGAAIADLEDHLWIRRLGVYENTAPVYDVLNADGTLLRRIAIPTSSVVAGFGHRGRVYLAIRDSTGTRLSWALVP